MLSFFFEKILFWDMFAYIEPSVPLFFIFYFLCSWSLKVLSHILRLCQFCSKDFSYARQGAQNYVFIHAERWQARVGIFNLNRTYIKKIEAPKLPLKHN